MRHAVSLGLVLLILWGLLSGHAEPLLIGLGIVSVVAVVLIARRMDLIDHEGHPIHLSPRAAAYWPWLLWQIVKANTDVARVIVQGRMPISPRLVRVEALQRSELGQVIFANSITLTPGTVTIALEDGALTVHALTTAAADDLGGAEPGEMNRRCARLEGGQLETSPAA